MSDWRDQMNQRVQRARAQMDLREMHKQAAQMQSAQVDTTVLLPLDAITVDERIQVRVGGLDSEKVEQYAVVMSEGGEMPPVVVFRDATTEVLYLADGFHRFAAARRAGLSTIRAEVRPGAYDGAFEYAEDANLEHGLALSTRDKRNIFERRLKRGHEWATLSDREISRQLGVNNATIGRWRAAISNEAGVANATGERLGADGKTYQISGIQEAARNRGEHQSQKQAFTPEPPSLPASAPILLDSPQEDAALTDVQRATRRDYNQLIDSLSTLIAAAHSLLQRRGKYLQYMDRDQLDLIAEQIWTAIDWLQGWTDENGQTVIGARDHLDHLLAMTDELRKH